MASLSDSGLANHLSGASPEASVPPPKKQKLTSEPRLEDHLIGVPPEALDRPCSDDHLKELAVRLTDWQEIGLFLDLDEGEMEDIKNSAKTVRARSLKMLRKWRNKSGENATYRCVRSRVSGARLIPCAPILTGQADKFVMIICGDERSVPGKTRKR